MEPVAPAEGAPPEVGELAAVATEYVQRALGVPVDYEWETLPVVDHYLTLVRQDLPERPELLELVTRAVGSYFGEVVCRRWGGFWVAPTGDVHGWRVCLRSVLLAFNPVGIVYDVLFQGEEHEGPSAAFLLAPDEREVVEERLQVLPEVKTGEYYMLATRLEVMEIIVEALLALQGEAGEAAFELDDYEGLLT